MSTLIRAFVGYFVLLLTVRILSRRPGGQLTLFEFVIVFLIGGVAIQATVGRDHSMTNCGTAILAVALLHRVLSWCKQHSPQFGALLDGTPLFLVRDGKWQSAVMQKMRVDPQDVMAAARAHQVTSIFDVKYAILERNGSISIIRQPQG